MEMEETGRSGPERPRSPPRRQRACLHCCAAKARCNFKDENIGKFCDRYNTPLVLHINDAHRAHIRRQLTDAVDWALNALPRRQKVSGDQDGSLEEQPALPPL